MSDIRYICLSDMHLGEEDSLLTNLKTASTDIDPFNPSPVMERLVECIRELLDSNEDKDVKPTLILNGDILEMALCTTNNAAMVFERFFELVMSEGKELFEKIVYIPGNHDHHLWETARESQYAKHVERRIGWGKPLDKPWHTTNIFVADATNPVPSYFLTTLVQRYGGLKEKGFEVQVAYPNLGLLSNDKQKCVIFSHGHYIEWLYHLMSKLRIVLFPGQKMPEEIRDIEEENFAWIDFFWSAMGRSGKVGEGIEKVYEGLLSEKGRKRLVRNLSEGLAKELGWGWTDRIEAKALEVLLNGLVKHIAGSEKKQTKARLSEDAEKGLRTYLQEPLYRQILAELDQNMPRDVTFVFGHTHKPFEDDLNFRGYPKWVNVYNSGGWVVESDRTQEMHGGSIILVDKELNTTAVRMYNEKESASEYSVNVNDATHPGEPQNKLYEKVSGIVNPAASLWKDFSDAVSSAVTIRQKHLAARNLERG